MEPNNANEMSSPTQTESFLNLSFYEQDKKTLRLSRPEKLIDDTPITPLASLDDLVIAKPPVEVVENVRGGGDSSSDSGGFDEITTSPSISYISSKDTKKNWWRKQARTRVSPMQLSLPAETVTIPVLPLERLTERATLDRGSRVLGASARANPPYMGWPSRRAVSLDTTQEEIVARARQRAIASARAVSYTPSLPSPNALSARLIPLEGLNYSEGLEGNETALFYPYERNRDRARGSTQSSGSVLEPLFVRRQR
eukprot:IDg18143t1